MGYELHITRATNWLDAESQPIREQDWARVLTADRSLSQSSEDYFERKDAKKGTVRIPSVVWSGDSDVIFWFDRGEITIKNPNDAAILKMLEVARLLDARVLGDDDEEYVLSPRPPGYLANREGSERPKASPRPWWRFW